MFQHTKKGKTTGQIFVHLSRTPYLQRHAFAKHQQTGGVVDLAVKQHHRTDTGIPQGPSRPACSNWPFCFRP